MPHELCAQQWPGLLAAVLLLFVLLLDRQRLRRQRDAARRAVAAARRDLDVARRDPLTGLATRALFVPAAQRLVDQHGDDSLVLILDANGLKALNDSRGHAAGDALICTIACRLETWIGNRGIVARLGGDEFAVALHLPAADHRAALHDLAAAINQPMTLDGAELPVSAAIGAASPATAGVSRVDGRPGLIRAADGAMYRSKHDPSPFDVGTDADADADTLNGRRAGRPGTHLTAALAA